MKSFLFLLFCIFSGLTFSQLTPLSIGKNAPMADHRMPSTSDEMLSLNTLKQEGLIVIFTSNTCPFVVGFNDGTFGGWENSYNSIFQKASAANINVVLVNSNEAKRDGGESMADMIQRKSDKGFSMSYVLDKGSELANAFGAKTTPHVFFFDRNLKLIYTGSIDNSFEDKRKTDIPYLMNAIDAYSNEKKIKTKSTSPKGCSIKRLKS
jgi:thioredoxin-related protein